MSIPIKKCSVALHGKQPGKHEKTPAKKPTGLIQKELNFARSALCERAGKCRFTLLAD